MAFLRSFATVSAVAVLALTASCGGESLEEGGGSGDGTSSQGTPDSTTGGGTGGGTSLTLSGQDFTEMQIMASMYEQVLENAGFTVETKLVSTRDIYFKEMSAGEVDVVPEYVAGVADYLGAADKTTNDADQTLKVLEPLAAKEGITMLEPSEATDQNAFFVTEEFAQSNDVSTLSDLAKLNKPVKLAAAPDCVGRDDCEKGLEQVYGIDISEVVPLGFGTQPTKNAVLEGEVTLGQTGTTDGSLGEQGLVLLEDDKGIQPAQNLIPAVNTEFLEANPSVEQALNELSATLTTEQLGELNYQVDVERAEPDDVAQTYLEDEGLI